MGGYDTNEDKRKFSSASSMRESTTPPLPSKKRRITRACDRCHKGGTKCSAGPTPDVCGPCSAFGSECTYERPIKRRGPATKSHSNGHRENQRASSSRSESVPISPLVKDENWTYHEIASHEQIQLLIDAYYRIVYPLQPFFHWPTFTSAIKGRLYERSRSFHCVTMSVCALSSARLRDGAPPIPINPSTPSKNNSSKENEKHIESEIFYQSAVSSFPLDLTKAGEFDYKRSKYILSTCCLQYGDIQRASVHMGDYCTLSSLDGFQNESRWSMNLNQIEIQERRRLFWSGYQNDVYIATTFGGIIRHREAQSTVLYPAEVRNDDYITEDKVVISNDPSHTFWSGWNFVTSLYRILEHAVCQMRQRHQSYDGDNQIAMLFSIRREGRSSDPGPEEVLQTVERLYNILPERYKITKEMTGDECKDRYGFQAANILITLQTVKMVMAGMADWSVEQRCAIAGELVDSLAVLPKAFIQACSCPMLHHTAGVGHLLASIIQSPLSPATYLHVRTVLSRMSNLLSSLETSIKSASILCIAEKLRDHIERIDRYMMSASEASGWNFALGSATLSDQSNVPPASTMNIYPPLAPAIPLKSDSIISTILEPTVQQLPSLDPAISANTLHPPEIVNGTNGIQLQPESVVGLDDANALVDQQVQLPNDLFSDWSFMFGEFGAQGDAFDFLSSGMMNTNSDW
ncbi:uncharacterized protein IL334_002858 [Kwoniella shivajii]|uniref:Zn(2)-C6 fungal-type domain-containing protein n=1 Tax=Kwoniella shivajii TaxID=564305 RepID=A0ABZ1D023_9TREE|nr:hypothetical protein IL334_002858 [Kwoniella shivajii]